MNKVKRKNKIINFLKEYKELCLRHGLQIKGCGECGSAWVEELGDQQKKNSLLVWEQFYNDGSFQVVRFADDFDLVNKNFVGKL